jgi:hypothetical protein
VARRAVPLRPGSVQPGGIVNLPYAAADNAGNQWSIYQGGWLQQSGNMPLYSQGAMLTVNGANAGQNANQARLDEQTGEIVFENMAVGQFTVTRRVLIDTDTNFVRYIDVVKNPGAQEQTATIGLSSTMNYGVQQSQTVGDPKRKGQDVGWVAQTHGGAAVVEVYAGKNAKLAPTVMAQGNNNVVRASLQVSIKPGREVAMMHLHGTAANMNAGAQRITDLKEKELLKSLPRDLRKLLVNFVVSQNFVPEVEVLRGGMADVVELRGGDQVKGTLKEMSYSLQTFYGPVELPAEQVVGMINAGKFRPRQLLITNDGQILGGLLKKQTIDLQLSSGQVTQVPLAQVARVGYRKRDGEPEEWTFDKPLVLMRGGERVGVKMPQQPVEVLTRYGRATLKPEIIAAVLLQSEDTGVHEFHLTDGSRFAGLLGAEQLEMVLESGKGEPVKFPLSTVARIQFAGKIAEQDDATPTLELSNDDVLVGSLAGQIKLETAFDTLDVSAAEIKSMTHPAGGGSDVTATLWDGTTLSGQVQDPVLQVTLGSGGTMSVPVSLLGRYEQPQPQPSPPVIETIRGVIGDLNADDWKKRDRAQAQLTAMGPVAIGVLRKLREAQPPEAQQRIDAILKELEQRGKSGAGGAGAAGGAATRPGE